ncbi:insulinase family protein [Paraglaciecola sp.]|uniref:insulinase family protein n=1 Tax=Paraglaciecola sp. TaxID=1920173 RepID=UPI0030F499F5
MLKNATDPRQYEQFILPNGMRILLVEDLRCQKTACSATLHVGHFDDHDDCHGLSHLLEHLLFLGNTFYPQANALSDFVAAHGGTINASTGTEYTSYFFDVLNEHVDVSLAHFSAMLSSPLLSETYIEKEIQAIDAEFQLKQKDDLRRLYQVHKETCNPAHPFSKFSVGNSKTFGHFTATQLNTKLRHFHQRYYRAANLGLCLISRQSLADSKKLITKHFGQWQDNIQVKRAQHPPLYLEQNLGVQINIEPLQHAQRLIITFALPGQQDFYRTKPLAFLSHILGDEGHGGLLDYYKSKNWATSLSAGGGIEGSNFKDFNINLQLTKQGLAEIDTIVSTLFAYINLIKQQGLESWRLGELTILNKLMWDYGEPLKPIDEALKLSHALFEYPQEHYLAGDYILDKPCIELVRQMLVLFNPQNMRLKLIHKSLKTNKLARWYDTPYKLEAISESRLTQYVNPPVIEQLKLPQANGYLPDCEPVSTLQPDFKLPQRIIAETGLELWFGQDHKFLQPKGDCFLTFDCAASANGIGTATYKRLWVALINEKLKQKYYQANLAGMHFHLYPHQGGFSLQTNGFSARQLDFCTQLLTQIVVSEDFSSNFEQIKANQHQSLSNSLLNKPINRLFSRLSVLMQQYNYAPTDMADIMVKAQLQDVLATKNQLLDSFYMEGMMYGNWGIEDTHDVLIKVKQFRHEYRVNPPVQKGLADLRNLTTQMHNVDCQHSDEAVVFYFQAPSASIKDIALTILLEQLVATPFFNQMRTERQLGYLVGSGYLPYNQHPGIALYIQSPHQSAQQLIIAIQQFLTEFCSQLLDYQDIWPSLKASVKRQLGESDTHLSMLSQRLWMAIGNKDFNFEYQAKMTGVIEKLTFSDITLYCQQWVMRQQFGELILVSTKDKKWQQKQTQTVITSIAEFKESSLYLH